MTATDAWDRELEVVANEISTLKTSNKLHPKIDKSSLASVKIKLLQAQIQLERSLDRIGKASSRDFLLLPRDRTMLHWGKVYREQLSKLIATQAKSANQSLWLKLIKSRLGTPTDKPMNAVDAEDLVALAIRQKNLLKTEKSLSSQLIALGSKKKSLFARYEQFEIAQANRHASGSLAARLGTNLQDALASPEMRALELYVQQLSAALRATPDAELQSRQQDFADHTARMLDEAKNIVVATTQEDDDSLAPVLDTGINADLDDFQAALRELADLEAETRAAYDKLLAATPPAAHPQLVSKRPSIRKSGKKDREKVDDLA